MSLEANIGKRGNILEVGPENASQVYVIQFYFIFLKILFFVSISYTRWFMLTFFWLSNICPLTYTFLSVALARFSCLVLSWMKGSLSLWWSTPIWSQKCCQYFLIFGKGLMVHWKICWSNFVKQLMKLFGVVPNCWFSLTVQRSWYVLGSSFVHYAFSTKGIYIVLHLTFLCKLPFSLFASYVSFTVLAFSCRSVYENYVLYI